MKEVNLKLSIDETNTILSALGEMPYRQVYGIIEKIQLQAGQQLAHKQNGNSEKTEVKASNN